MKCIEISLENLYLDIGTYRVNPKFWKHLDTLLTEMHAHGTAPINAHCFDYWMEAQDV